MAVRRGRQTLELASVQQGKPYLEGEKADTTSSFDQEVTTNCQGSPFKVEKPYHEEAYLLRGASSWIVRAQDQRSLITVGR